MRIYVHMLYQANSICAEFHRNTEKKQHCSGLTKTLDVIRNSYSYSHEFCSKQCSLIWTIQIRIDSAQSDVILPADIILVDFLDFYLVVVTSQT